LGFPAQFRGAKVVVLADEIFSLSGDQPELPGSLQLASSAVLKHYAGGDSATPRRSRRPINRLTLGYLMILVTMGDLVVADATTGSI
jgi:hypothetical protein